MRCKVCGKITKKTTGVHFVEGQWLLLEAEYCFKHGSFINRQALNKGIKVEVTEESFVAVMILDGSGYICY